MLIASTRHSKSIHKCSLSPVAVTATCTAPSVGNRTGHSLTYDATRHEVVLYGGTSDDPANPYPRTLWSWDGERWQCLDENGPSGRRDAFLAYDPARKKLVLFAGRTISRDRQTHFYRDTWEWDGKSWTQVDSAGPALRIHGATAYDARRKGIVVHSGGGANDLRASALVPLGAKGPCYSPQATGADVTSTSTRGTGRL
jgi:hypothetical protein